jgi:chromosome segregation protein
MEAVARESAWHAAQTERLDGEATAARDALEARTDPPSAPGRRTHGGGQADDALGAWEWRVEELRGQRDQLAAGIAVRDAARRESESRRARAEAAAAIDEERITRADREAATLAERSRHTEAEREALRMDLASAVALEAGARAALDELLLADTSDRERLASAERGAAEARDRLRGAEDRLRGADRAELEARLGLDSLREQVLVELAGLGVLGRRHLAAAVDGHAVQDDGQTVTDAPDAIGERGDEPGAALDEPGETEEATEAAALEAALDQAAPVWAATAPQGEPPNTGRLAALRRRYHEVGAANPFAVEEYAALRARLETLDGQATDLRAAIVATRRLIEELGAMIAEQFSATFHALEAAFDRRFNQLFGGGYAKLALTDPDDPSASGIEIVARPPGKKAQALAMLSGGERALTAVALLFAMLEVRPVPFCVLDEVDAALDEANVGRFSDALRGLADRTQFVVITHNRGTIEAADALYGVTVGDDSVSRVISLRLEEARAIADLHRPSEPATVAIG